MSYIKMVRYGDTLEVYSYEKNLTPAQRGIRRHAGRNGLPVLASDREDALRRAVAKRQDNARRARMVFIRLVSSNLVIPVRPLLITFTYAENMQDVRQGYRDFCSFNKLARRKFGTVFSYIAVPEFQKRGAVHFHALYWNLPTWVFDEERSTRMVAGIWGKGFVFMKQTYGNEGIAHYLAKYMAKAYTDERTLGVKNFTCSRNLLRPLEQEISKAYDYIEDYKLSTDLSTCKVSRYQTQWLGACTKTVYKITK